ncbi:hypothetical protein PVL29_020895 [Vitis rotundifolia]|uniref:Uncharacterized protein n=1 Tax=Vitis rotundifolia TaxID=103349 RepID=A0AA39DE26_VITRO|nr:hypothetical protein PVL29_020895 [Vitis rotundifolia]
MKVLKREPDGLGHSIADGHQMNLMKHFREKSHCSPDGSWYCFRSAHVQRACSKPPSRVLTVPRLDDSLAVFRIALEHNPQSSEVSRKIKKLTQLARDKKRVQEAENKRSNVDMAKHLEALKSELSEKYRR